jgi:hypothetical protein
MSSASDSIETTRLLQRVADGNEGALDELLVLYARYLRRVVELRMEPELRARFDPSDAVRETQLEVIRRIDDFISPALRSAMFSSDDKPLRVYSWPRPCSPRKTTAPARSSSANATSAQL